MTLKHTWLNEFARFCLIGLICTLIDWAIFYLVKAYVHPETQILKQIIKAISFVFSASVSYILNRVWTFNSYERKIIAQASRFFIVATIGLGLNNLFFYWATGVMHRSDLVGLTFATGLVLFWNYAGSKFLVFNRI